MKPLWFLTSRSIKNAVIRSLSSPQRLVGLVFIVGYYFMVFVRPAVQGGGLTRAASRVDIPLPPFEAFEAIAFAGFALIAFIMMLGVLGSPMAFRPADVDILFATPISPRMVLLYRIGRDYLFALIMPLFIGVFFYRPVNSLMGSLFAKMPHPEQAGLAIKLMSIGWILMALGFVTMTYAVGLFTNRSDEQSTRNRRLVQGLLFGLTLAVLATIVIGVQHMESPKDWVALSHHPVLRIGLFPATLVTWLATGPLEGNVLHLLLGLGGLLGMIGGGFFLALSQSGWMYDQAATRGYGKETLRNLHRKGDIVAMAAEVARQKHSKVRVTWFSRQNWAGPMAIVWKDILVFRRSLLSLWIFLSATGAFMTVMPALLGRTPNPQGIAYLMLLMMGMSTVMISMAIGQSGFTEFLRRVDLQKPMPFRASTIVLLEVATKAMFGIVGSLFGAIIAVILEPSLVVPAISSMLLAPGLALACTSVMFLMTILLPDNEDIGQRQVRGMLAMVALLIAVAPIGLLAFAGIQAQFPLVLTTGFAGLVGLGIGYLVCLLSAGLYTQYNPSD